MDLIIHINDGRSIQVDTEFICICNKNNVERKYKFNDGSIVHYNVSDRLHGFRKNFVINTYSELDCFLNGKRVGLRYCK